MTPKHVVVDGSNIATEGRSLPSLAQLDEAVRAFLRERPHEDFIVVVDATFEHRIDPSEKAAYDDALAAGELITPPAGTIGRGDKFLLEIAERADATVFSNDSFQEFHGEYTWLFDEGRLVGGKPVPGIGWIFTERTPVRGPKSRQATRAAAKKRTRGSEGASAKKAAKSAPRRASAAAFEPPPIPTAATPPPAPPPPPPGRSRKRRTPLQAAPREPVNEPLPFIEFIAEHPVGSIVVGEVVEFASHGAYVNVGGARCYVPLKSMGDPPPKSAREVLDRGGTREFVVAALDAPRRGIDLALPGAISVAGPDLAPVGDEAAVGRGPSADLQAAADAAASLPESEAPLAQRPARKATAKKATATKATTTKTKAATKKAPAKKTAAATKKASTATKRAPAKKASTTKKATTAKKAPANKTAAKTAPAKKATAKKATAKKATAAKKAPAKKATRATKKR